MCIVGGSFNFLAPAGRHVYSNSQSQRLKAPEGRHVSRWIDARKWRRTQNQLFAPAERNVLSWRTVEPVGVGSPNPLDEATSPLRWLRVLNFGALAHFAPARQYAYSW